MPVAKKTVGVKKPEITQENLEIPALLPKSEVVAEIKAPVASEVADSKNLVSMKPTPTAVQSGGQASLTAKVELKPSLAPRPSVVPIQPVKPYVDPNVEAITGALDIMPDGQGFVRPKFTPSPKDAVLPSMLIRRWGLRMGDMVSGLMRVAKEGEKYNAMTSLQKINGVQLSQPLRRPEFRDLVPVYAEKQVKLETEASILSTRIIDLFCPIGFGQRGMLVSPPKAGKTTLLKEIADGVSKNHPNVHLMAVLVGERPEEVTDMQRFIKGEVIASSFDQKPEEQTRAAEIAIERAKRLVEMGKDVFMVFDSITRLARAYNLAIPGSGRTLSGGFDPAALYPSKRFFGAARKIEFGGSLTIIGTSLVETGSKMDDLVFEEFKGTGNMELRLERELADRRIFPAFDILKSGTRREELLLDPQVLARIIGMRRLFDVMSNKNEVTEMIIEQMAKTKNNEEFMAKVGKAK